MRSTQVLKSMLLMGASLLTFSAVASAQETAENDAKPANGAIVLEQIVVTASSVATNVKDAPASISVVGQEQLQQKGAPDITEALRTVPGLNVGFGSDGTRGISMRGMGSGYTLILIDGKRVGSGLTTMRHYKGDLDWVPVDAIDRIEVVRGPMSTLYGSDALGGVVNIITKKTDDKWSGSLTTEWIQPESKATGVTKKVSAYVSGPIVPEELTFTAFGNISKKDASDPTRHDDIQTPSGSKDYDITGRLTWTPTDTQMFELEVGTGREKYLPYLEPNKADSETTIRRTTASLRHIGEWDFGTTTTSAFIEDTDNKHNVLDKKGENILRNSTINVRSYTVDSKVSMPLDFLFEQNLTLGAEYRYEEMKDPENLGKFNTVTGTVGAADTSMWTAAIFAEDQIKLTDDLKLTAGLRIDRHEKFGTHASPRLYFNYDVNDNLTLKAGWAQAFKAPNMRQLNPNWVQTSNGRGCGAVGGPCEMVGNPDLKPETSNSFELGGIYVQDNWEAGLTYFYNEIDDKITSARTASLILPGNKKFVQQINIDRARTQGVEGNLTITPHADWTWTNSFTYLIESRNLETGMPLSADPKYSINTELTWQVREDFSVTGGLAFYGKQVDYVSTPETLTAQNVSAYNIANISFKYDPTENFTFRAGVNNIFDKQPKSESNFVENGRSYFISLTSKF